MGIPPSEWKWYGCAGHLIVAEWCRFHLCTVVDPWIVSTVGEYVPDESVREILARSRGIALEGIGDVRRNDYMKKIGFEDIGLDRKYETMVFRAGDHPCDAPDCACGFPKPNDFGELDFDGYNTAGDATAGHMGMCEKWALKETA